MALWAVRVLPRLAARPCSAARLGCRAATRETCSPPAAACSPASAATRRRRRMADLGPGYRNASISFALVRFIADLGPGYRGPCPTREARQVLQFAGIYRSLLMSQVDSGCPQPGRFRSRACRGSDRPCDWLVSRPATVSAHGQPASCDWLVSRRGARSRCGDAAGTASRADSPRPHVRLAQWRRREAAPIGRAKEMPNQRRGLVGPGKSRRGLRHPHARDAPPRAALPGLSRRAASSGRRGCGYMLRWLQRRLKADSGVSQAKGLSWRHAKARRMECGRWSGQLVRGGGDAQVVAGTWSLG